MPKSTPSKPVVVKFAFQLRMLPKGLVSFTLLHVFALKGLVCVTFRHHRVLKGIFVVCAGVVVLSIGLLHHLTPVFAATSSTINFQARLETGTGSIVPDGTYNVEFKLYSAASGGTAEWTEDYTYNSGPGSTDARIRVANGYLSVNLGSITPFPGTINWNQQQWLTMNIGGTGASGSFPTMGDGEMSPRLQLTAVPYAFTSGSLSTTDGSGHTGTLSFPTSLTNATDSITLPDASGTVCLQGASACGFAAGSGSAFLQGGNSFGAQAVLGTIDNNSLAVKTNGTNRIVIDTFGNLQFQQASTLNVLSAAGGNQLIIQAGANSTAAGTGGTLLLQGGAPGTTGASGSVIIKANTNDSTGTFQVQNAAGTATLLNADTTNLKVTVAGDIANIFSSSLGLTQVSATTTYATGPEWVAVQGKYAYVVEKGGTPSLEILDVTNPTSPVRIGTMSLAKSTPKQIQVQGHYVYIAEVGASNAGAMEIVDVSNPSTPTSVTITPVANGGPFGVYISGRYAYVVDSATNDMAVIDIANPLAPSLVSTIPVNTSPRKVYVAGHYAYVASFGGTPKLQVINISNPASPSIVGTQLLSSSGDDVTVQGKYAYVTEYNAGTPQLDVVDISNPASLSIVATRTAAAFEYANVVSGRYLFTSGYNFGNSIAVTDVANPSAPTVLQTYTTGLSQPGGMALAGRYLFVANNTGNNLLILDVSGLETTAATIHSLEAGNLTVDTSSFIGGDSSIQGALTVGGNAEVSGDLGASGKVLFSNASNSTAAFQVQNASTANLFTVDTANTAIVLGNDGTPSALTVRGGAATGSNVTGGNITFDASNGTGTGGSGDLIFRTATPLSTTITLDTSAFIGDIGSPNSDSVNLTLNAHNNRMLIVGLGIKEASGTDDISTVTYGGVHLTRLSHTPCPGTAQCTAEVWYLPESSMPANGTNALVATLNAGKNHNMFLGGSIFYNVDQSGAPTIGNTATGIGDPVTITTSTSSTNQVVIDAVVNDNNPFTTPTAGQTELWNDSGGNNFGDGSYKSAGATSTTMSWPTFGAGNWADIAVVLNPVAGTSANTLTDRLHISASGNVGINTASPQHTLDVTGTGQFSTSILTPAIDTPTAGTLSIGTATATAITLGSGASPINLQGNVVQTSTGTSGDINSFTDNLLASGSANLMHLVFQNAYTAGAGISVNGLTIGAQASSRPSSGTNTSNLIRLITPATTLSNAVGLAYNGINVQSFALSTQTSASASLLWNGANIAMPDINQVAGTLTSNGISLTTGAITTGGTETGILLNATGVSAGILQGISISGITGGSGSETAISVGSGWDTQISGSGFTVGGSGATTIQNTSTAAFQVQSTSTNLFTVDTANTAIVLGNDGTPSALTVRGGIATGTNVAGSAITFDASNGTGSGGSGDLIFRTGAANVTTVTNDTNSSSTAASTNTLQWTHTTNNNVNRLLIVGVTIASTSLSVSSVTYHGANLTLLAAQNCASSAHGFNACRVEFWYMTKPDIGSYSIQVNVSGTVSMIDAGASTYYNVDQNTPIAASTTGTGFNNPSSVVLSGTTAQQLVVDVMGSNNVVQVPQGSATQRWNTNTTDSAPNASSSQTGGSGSTTVSWTDGASDYADIVAALNPPLATSSNALQDRLHIAASGNVGIGTSTPQHTLDVASMFGVDSTTKQIIVGAGSTGETASVVLVADSDTDATYRSGTATNAPTEVDGAIFYDNTDGYFMCGVSGSWETCTGLLYSNTAASTAVNTCTTACASFNKAAPIPANYCKPGRSIHIQARGHFSVTGTPTLGMGVYYGTNASTRGSDVQVGVSSPTPTAASGATNQMWALDFTIICFSATAMNGQGIYTFENDATTTNTMLSLPMISTGNSTVASTTAKNLYIFPTWSASSASNTVILDQLIVTGN